MFFIPGEPPAHCRRRPRSTSQAISATSKNDLCKPRSKEDHKTQPLNGGHSAVDRANAITSVSPPHPEDDLDLCPPAAGISSLDFDPMSFQCSPPSATPGLQRNKDANKWRKNAGCSSDSEPISSPNNNISCSQSPDISPDLWKGGDEVASEPPSPSLRKKCFTMQAPTSPSPLPSSSAPVERCDAPAHQPHRSPLSTASQATALTDLSQSAQNLPDPGEYVTSDITHTAHS